jgi:hypothetical protein
MAFGGTADEVSAGLAFQNGVLETLRRDAKELNIAKNSLLSNWEESRKLILRDYFHSRKEHELSYDEKNKLNLLESIRGDLIDYIRGISLECQTAVTKVDCGWEHSKRERCEADWQCFGFPKTGARLVVRTSSLRMYLDLWKVKPTPSKREGNSGYYDFAESVLRTEFQAVELEEWLERLKSDPYEL